MKQRMRRTKRQLESRRTPQRALKLDRQQAVRLIAPSRSHANGFAAPSGQAYVSWMNPAQLHPSDCSKSELPTPA